LTPDSDDLLCARLATTGFVAGVFALGCVLCAVLGFRPTQAQTQGPILGVNAAIGSMSVEQQNAILAELHAAGVHYVRTGLTPDDKGIDFGPTRPGAGRPDPLAGATAIPSGRPELPMAQRVRRMGRTTPLSRRPGSVPQIFRTAPRQARRSRCHPRRLRTRKRDQLSDVQCGLQPAAENPAQSREFNLADLSRDPKAQQMAKGYLQCLKLLAAIKDARAIEA
jgi:hypothetical protein